MLKAVQLPADAKAPTIDGDLSDPVWQRAAHAVTFYDPQSGKPATDQTEAFLLYDSDYIYVAIRCFDSQPDAIVARETLRDADLQNDDTVRVVFDTFHTYNFNDFCRFEVNPLGTRHTQLSGGRAGKLEWQGDWNAAARREVHGWTVEMQIPWGILPYPRRQGKAAFGLNFHRMQQRTKQESSWSDLGPQGFAEREGVWQDVEPPTQRWKPRLSLLPYLLPSGAATAGRSQFRSGLDARYQPTPELTAVATLNPDFASVEGAVESIGFSRSERFVPDKRPFFLEGSDYLGFGQFYELGSFFDSQRIQHMDTGVKLYGKLNNQTTIGMLSAIGVGNESDFVTQVRREFSPTSNASLILLQRLAPGQDNTVAAFSPSYRRGKWSLNGQVAQTFGPEAGGMAWTGAVNLEDKNLFTTLRYRRSGASFLDRLGFFDFNGFKGWSSYTDWAVQWHHGSLRAFELAFGPTFDWHLDGRPFRRNANLDIDLETRNDYRVGFHLYGGTFDHQTDFTYGMDFGGGISNRFRQWHLAFTAGKQADLPYSSFGPSFSVRAFKKLDLALGSFIQNYQGVQQQHILTFNYEMSPYRAIGGRLVIQDAGSNVYFSYRNAGRRGMDTYFIIGDPNSQKFAKRAMLKLVFAL